MHRSDGKTVQANLLEYLAYGALAREYLAPDSTFRLVLRIREEKYLREVAKALKAFILFGGLGAKSRNGYGSFQVTVEEAPGEIKREIELLKPDKTLKQKLCTLYLQGYTSLPCILRGGPPFRNENHLSYLGSLPGGVGPGLPGSPAILGEKAHL